MLHVRVHMGATELRMEAVVRLMIAMGMHWYLSRIMNRKALIDANTGHCKTYSLVRSGQDEYSRVHAQHQLLGFESVRIG